MLSNYERNLNIFASFRVRDPYIASRYPKTHRFQNHIYVLITTMVFKIVIAFVNILENLGYLPMKKFHAKNKVQRSYRHFESKYQINSLLLRDSRLLKND